MSSVQSIRRAFAVLDALGEGPLGVTDVADRAGLPKSTAARLLATLAGEGAVEQVPGRHRVPARTAARDAGRRVQPHPLAGRGRAPDAGRSGRSVRGGGRARRAGRRPRPLHRPGRHAEPGRRPRLDRGTGAAPRGLVRAGAPGVPHAGGDRALPRPTAWSGSRTATLVDAGCRPRAAARRPAARATPGRSRSSTRASRRSRRPIADGSGEVIAAVHVHGPSYRFPPAGGENAWPRRS